MAAETEFAPAKINLCLHVTGQREDGYHLLDGLVAEDVLARLDVPVMLRGPEATEWQCIRDDHAAMADAGEWPDLLEALRFADQDRTMVSGGYRVAPLISDGIRARMTSSR